MCKPNFIQLNLIHQLLFESFMKDPKEEVERIGLFIITLISNVNHSMMKIYNSRENTLFYLLSLRLATVKKNMNVPKTSLVMGSRRSGTQLLGRQFW